MDGEGVDKRERKRGVGRIGHMLMSRAIEWGDGGGGRARVAASALSGGGGVAPRSRVGGERREEAGPICLFALSPFSFLTDAPIA